MIISEALQLSKIGEEKKDIENNNKNNDIINNNGKSNNNLKENIIVYQLNSKFNQKELTVNEEQKINQQKKK